MKKEQKSMREEQQEMKRDQQAMRSENEKQFSEIMNKLSDMQADQDHIWEKAARNARELAKLSIHLHL